MPFDFDAYQKECNVMTAEQLQKEWENYTRQITAGATSTATSVLLAPYTAGLSLIGLGISAPRIHNARKKREIIEAGLHARGTSPHTRTRDVVTAMGVSGTVSGLTLGIMDPGIADAAVGALFQHGAEFVAGQAVSDGAGAVLVTSIDDMSRRRSSADAWPHLPLTQSNLQGSQGNFPHKPSLPSHSWSFDTMSTDTTKTGPLSTPYVEEDSVLFHPAFEASGDDQTSAQHNLYSEPDDDSMEDAGFLTHAQQEVLRKMEFLRLEMQKRQTHSYGEDSEKLQISGTEIWDKQLLPNDIQGLGISGVDQHHPNLPALLQTSNLPTMHIEPPTPAKPYTNQRSESLPAELNKDDHETFNSSQSNENNVSIPLDQQNQPTPHLQTRFQSVSTRKPVPIQAERQDSGYFSAASTPSITGLVDQSNVPHQDVLPTLVSSPQPLSATWPKLMVRHSVSSTADTGLHRHNHVKKRHRASESAASCMLKSTLTSSLPPSSPLPGPTSPLQVSDTQPDITLATRSKDEEQDTVDVTDIRDYFNSQNITAVRSLAKKKSHAMLQEVNQGWQWTKAFAISDSNLQEEVEKYGPPLAVPVAWASS